MSNEKKFVVEIHILEQTENENMDAFFLKKTYEMCKGKKNTLNALKNHYDIIKGYIEDNL